jgi:protein-tyrosine phosphatase
MIGVRSSNSKETLPSKGIIFIGNAQDAVNSSFLISRNIVGILNAANELPDNSHRYPVHYLKLDLIDVPSQNILKYLKTVYNFLEQNLQTGNVLVHCFMGISRSVSLVIGYIMLKYPELDYKTIYYYIKSHRYIANPNSGFKAQLLSLEAN